MGAAVFVRHFSCSSCVISRKEVGQGEWDLLSTGNTALDRSQTGALDICLPDEIFWANKPKYSDRSSTALGFTAWTLSSG